MTGANRCRTHGGNSRGAGPGHHRYKHGGASKLNVPMGIEAKAREAMNDPELMDLRFDAAIISEIIKEVLAGDRAVGMNEVRQAYRELDESMQAKDFAKARNLLMILGEKIGAAAKSEDGLRRIESLICRRTQTVAVERRLQIQQGMMISAAAVSHALSRFVHLVIENAAGCAGCGGKTIKAVRDEYALIVGASHGE